MQICPYQRLLTFAHGYTHVYAHIRQTCPRTCLYISFAHMSTCVSVCRRNTVDNDQLSDELGWLNSAGSFVKRHHSPPASLREASNLAAAKKDAAAKTSSFGLLALQDKLSFHHWSMIDATPSEIKLLVADVVAYKWNVAAGMIAKCWRRYVFQTRAEALVSTTASPTSPLKVWDFRL